MLSSRLAQESTTNIDLVQSRRVQTLLHVDSHSPPMNIVDEGQKYSSVSYRLMRVVGLVFMCECGNLQMWRSVLDAGRWTLGDLESRSTFPRLSKNPEAPETILKPQPSVEWKPFYSYQLFLQGKKYIEISPRFKIQTTAATKRKASHRIHRISEALLTHPEFLHARPRLARHIRTTQYTNYTLPSHR